MKKTLLFVSVLALGTTYAQNCSELFISEYVEGSGNDKALEIYNPTGSAIDLAGYRVERFSNGEATSAAGGVLNLSGSIAPYSTFVIVNGVGVTSTATGSSPAASTTLQAMADLLDGAYPAPTFMNGNDAIALFNGSTMIDLMGKIGDASMVSSQSWSDAFPKDTWTELGQHTCDCFLGLTENTNAISFAVYPNPSSTGNVIISASEEIEFIEVINILGQVVLTAEVKDLVKTTSLNASDLTKGVYTVRIRFANKSLSQTSIAIQ